MADIKIKNDCKKLVENNLVKICLVGYSHLIKVNLIKKKVNIKAKLFANKLVVKFSRHRVDRGSRYKIGRDELMQLRFTKSATRAAQNGSGKHGHDGDHTATMATDAGKNLLPDPVSKWCLCGATRNAADCQRLTGNMNLMEVSLAKISLTETNCGRHV